MKIAFIGQKGLPAKYGGVERHVHELATRLVKFDFKVIAYARKWYTNAKNGEFEGISIKHTPTVRTKHLDTITHTLFATIDAIRSKNDIIHFHGVGPSLLSWIPRVFAPKTLVITTFHSMDRKQMKWGIFAKLILRMGEWTAIHFAHKTIVVSDVMAHYLNLKYDVNSVCLPNGVPDLKKSEKFETLKKWGIKKDGYILVVARLIPDKGVHNLITAYLQAKKEKINIVTDKKLVIVGAGASTDKYVNKLHKMAEGEKDIIFTGVQIDESLRELFSGASVLVNPSNNEGLPITVLESMSYGISTVASDIPAHKQLIKTKDFLFKTDNVNSLMKTLTKVLSKSKGEIKEEIHRNKTRVQRDYNWDTIVDETINVYKSEYTNMRKMKLVKTA
ncbi:MAG: glycosyltransferase family 4 protein [Candidatus Magasanikbacteria bacterium]|nr:glycosyltransferase family 4 protein [Candidatus Magasanikbacteria bacterium]